ncbi:MAG: hydroxysqualene dehydroxylase HpnE [Actinomycetia bacterium]|nr:hydroxysqualene dehydroxylase HpnE [Actinomycetes bacterium]
MRRAVVVGGGWAGLSAAWTLAHTGWAVVLLERRPVLGGRAFSFWDPRAERVLDNGQHVLLGACTAVRSWLRSLGLDAAIRFEPRLDLPVFADGFWGRLYSRPWPGGLHLLAALAGYRLLTPRERLALGRAARGLARPAPDAMSFRTWLLDHGQSPHAIDRFWDLVVTAVLNCRADEASAALATQAFRLGLLRGAEPARLGFFRWPLGQVAHRIGKALEGAGIRIRLGTAVKAVRAVTPASVQVLLDDGTELHADAAVLAVPPDRIGALVETAEPAKHWQSLGWSPIVNVYLLYDRPVDAPPVFALADGEGSAFVFDRDHLLGAPPGRDGSLLAVSLSAARSWLGRPAAQLAVSVAEGVARAIPAAQAARLVYWRVVWQRRATFWARPGCETIRPVDPRWHPSVVVAGDWTGTGWPASLESAVRSGQAAAACLNGLPPGDHGPNAA